MKIAVLLTGQIRTCDIVKYLHMNTIISKYDTDVFLSIDLDNSLQCEYQNSIQKTQLEKVENIINFFNPVDYFILKNYDEEFIKIINNNSTINNKTFKLVFEQYYIVKNAYKMLIQHIKEKNKEYDIIIRLRFDQILFINKEINDFFLNLNKNSLYSKVNCELINNLSKNEKLNFDTVLDNEIYLFGFGDFKHYKYANDQFWYHNAKLIEIIFNFYDNMLNLIYNCFKENTGLDGAFIENLWYTYLTRNDIIMKQTSFTGVFLREK
jgi:hypothetical protein